MSSSSSNSLATRKRKTYVMAFGLTAFFMTLIGLGISTSEPLRLSMLSLVDPEKAIIIAGNTDITAQDIFYLFPTAMGVFGVCFGFSHFYYSRKH